MIEKPSKPCIVGLGEALFDVFDSGPRLGGAPLNAAVHSHRLLQPVGGEGRVVSKVANDTLGHQLLKQVEAFGLSTATIQRGGRFPTGRVEIEQHADGGHTFHIAKESAWDEIEFDADAASLAESCDAVAFGTLAQRSVTSRATVQAFLAAAPNALKLFDVNFRSSDGIEYFDGPTMIAGCQAADLVKVNDEELQQTCELTQVDNPQQLLDRFNLQAVILTRGKEGTTALTSDGWVEGKTATYDRQDGADTVGAGDACTAGLLSALASGRPLDQALDLANHMGAFVANQQGATPNLPPELAEWLA